MELGVNNEQPYSRAISNELFKAPILIFHANCGFFSPVHDVVIVGDPNHPEVIGINGWADDQAIVIQTPEQAEAVTGKELVIVSQTTIRKELFEQVVHTLEKNNTILKINNTICSATSERQNACAKLAAESDLMVVIGGKESSNTKKLWEISKKYCENTYFIEFIEDLPLKAVEKCCKIGVAAGASTPERIIKEVIAAMSEAITKDLEMVEEMNEMEAMMDEIEKSLRLPGRGEIVTGEIVHVTNDYVVVNLGCKKDGVIPKDEMALEQEGLLTELFKEGDEIQAKVIKTDDGDGNILLSKKKLQVNEHWDEINAALDDKEVVNVKIVKEVKGGVIATYKEVSGFIPMSQLSDHFVEKADEFIGKVLPVKVSRVDQKRNKAVFSHKAFLAEEKAKKIAEIWDKLSVGDVVEGVVMRFTDYGAFVDIGGLDGLLHISEISWGKLKHPQEALAIGDAINVKILSMNAEKGKISLGLKQNMPEPWSVIDDKYEVGQVISGKVVQIKDYGAFVELEPGLDGLVHISEVAYKRVTNIADEISVGQEVSAKILEIDKDRKRISLSIKETLEAPAAEVAEEAADEE
ncbi:MAG: 30S ribosomal protein S1 [Firmicutes bacterium]|nr:30S ribosomal protein S1 [Bacillota bacterium]